MVPPVSSGVSPDQWCRKWPHRHPKLSAADPCWERLVRGKRIQSEQQRRPSARGNIDSEWNSEVERERERERERVMKMMIF